MESTGALGESILRGNEGKLLKVLNKQRRFVSLLKQSVFAKKNHTNVSKTLKKFIFQHTKLLHENSTATARQQSPEARRHSHADRRGNNNR